jgi:hypothetical protein
MTLLQKAAIKRILNANKNNSVTGIYHYNDEYLITNNYLIIIVDEELEVTKNNSIDFEKLFNMNNPRELTLPDVKELRTYISSEKKHLKKCIGDKVVKFDFGDGLPMVNAQFLLDIMTILPHAHAEYDLNYPFSIRFNSENGKAILLSIRKSKSRY